MQVLNNQRVHAYLIELICHLYSLRILVLMQQCVDGHEYLDSVSMGIIHHLRQVLDAVSRFLARTEGRGTDVDGIRTGLNSRDSDFFIFCGR